MLLPIRITWLSDRTAETGLQEFFWITPGAMSCDQTSHILGSGKTAPFCQLQQQDILFVIEHYLELVGAGSVTFWSHFSYHLPSVLGCNLWSHLAIHGVSGEAPLTSSVSSVFPKIRCLLKHKRKGMGRLGTGVVLPFRQSKKRRLVPAQKHSRFCDSW